MPNRFYNTVDKNEAFGPGPNVVELPDTNLFFQDELPKGQQYTYDIDGIVNGQEATPPPAFGTPEAIWAELDAGGVNISAIVQALYKNERGDAGALTSLNATIDAIALSQGVPIVAVIDNVG